MLRISACPCKGKKKRKASHMKLCTEKKRETGVKPDSYIYRRNGKGKEFG